MRDLIRFGVLSAFASAIVLGQGGGAVLGQGGGAVLGQPEAAPVVRLPADHDVSPELLTLVLNTPEIQSTEQEVHFEGTLIEVAAQVGRRAQVNRLAAQQGRQLALDARHVQ